MIMKIEYYLKTSQIKLKRTIKFKIGFCPQYGGFFSDLTLLENLKCVGEILIKDDRKRNETTNP